MFPHLQKTYKKITASLITLYAALMPFIFVPAYTTSVYFGDGYTMPKALFLYSFVIAILIVYGIGRLSAGDRDEAWFTLPVGLMFLLLALSTLLTPYPDLVFYGNFRRLEGFLTLFSYLVLLYTAHKTFDRQDAEQLVRLLIFCALPIAVYGLLQYYGVEPFPLDYWKSRGSRSAIVTIGNRNMTGTYAALVLSLAIARYLGKPKPINLVAAALLFALLVAAMTRGVWLGIFVSALLTIWVFRDFAKEHKKQILVLVIVFSLIFVFMSFDQYLLNRLFSLTAEMDNLLTDRAALGSGRGTIYRHTVPLLKDYLLIGSGPETFQEVFDQEAWYAFRESRTTYVDRAHSEPLHMWVTLGFPYLAAYFFLVWITLKKRKEHFGNDPFLLGLFFAVLTYLVQSMFNISVLSVAPLYYILLGLPVFSPAKEETDLIP